MNGVAIPHLTMKIINTLALASALAVNVALPAVVKEIDRHTLCSRFPLNSRCEDFSAAKGTPTTHQLDRDRFCEKFALNSKCQQKPLQVIKLNLDRSGENDEWIRLEKQDSRVRLVHTTKVKDGLVSGVLNGAIGALVPLPLPFVEANKYDWQDNIVTAISFRSDRCQGEKCIVAGKNSIALPKGMDIYRGKFTIEYREKELERSLTFRIPADVEAETINTISVTHVR